MPFSSSHVARRSEAIEERLDALECPLDAEAAADPNTDQFLGDSLGGSWTSPATSANAVTTSISGGILTLEPSASGSASTASPGGFGIRKTVAAGDFTISAKIVDGGSDGGTDDARVGIFAGDPGNSGQIVGYQNSTARLVNANQFAAYSITANWGANQADNFLFASQPNLAYWYKMFYDESASTLDIYYSGNGYRWSFLVQRTSVPAYEHVGLALWANISDIRADHKLLCHWFRLVQ